MARLPDTNDTIPVAGSVAAATASNKFEVTAADPDIPPSNGRQVECTCSFGAIEVTGTTNRAFVHAQHTAADNNALCIFHAIYCISMRSGA